MLEGARGREIYLITAMLTGAVTLARYILFSLIVMKIPSVQGQPTYGEDSGSFAEIDGMKLEIPVLGNILSNR